MQAHLLRSHKQHADAWRIGAQVFIDVILFVEALAAREAGGGDACLCEVLHLVHQQGHQRRDDDRHAAANECRQLVAPALAAAGRHEYVYVPVRERSVHHLRHQPPGQAACSTDITGCGVLLAR